MLAVASCCRPRSSCLSSKEIVLVDSGTNLVPFRLSYGTDLRRWHSFGLAFGSMFHLLQELPRPTSVHCKSCRSEDHTSHNDLDKGFVVEAAVRTFWCQRWWCFRRWHIVLSLISISSKSPRNETFGLLWPCYCRNVSSIIISDALPFLKPFTLVVPNWGYLWLLQRTKLLKGKN